MKKDTALHEHIRARIKRKPNRLMKRSFIESAMCYHNIILLLMGMLVFMGLAGIVNMPKQEMPVFTIRQGAVVAVCPGSTSQEIEERVTKPLEDFVFGYKEVRKDKTYSQTKDGMAIVYVELNADIEDKDAFWSKFKHGLSAFKMQLPSSVAAVQAVDDIAETSALLITIESGQKTYRELRGYLDDLKSRLRRIDAISNMRTYGLQMEQLTVYLDQQKLAKYGIGSFTILNSLAMQGLTTYSGLVEDGSATAPIHINDAYNSELDVANQIVYSTPSGDVIRLKDVARIVREYPQMDKYIKSNGKKCVLLSVEMRPGNDIVKMGRDVRKQIDSFKKELPNEVRLSIITDQSRVVSESVVNFLRELLISVISVIVVVVLLMPRRVAEVSAMSIPITIFTSVGIFYIFGFELNTVTLAALIVTLGMVVDDSVVIIDNYMEKLGHGMSRWHASIAAPREFFMSVLSATLSISLTFFPFLFTMKGEMADFVKSFPWAMFIILTVSLTVSLILTPYLQYTFIHEGIKENNKASSRRTPLDYLQAGYTWLLTRCFRHPRLTLVAGLGVVVIGVCLFSKVPQRMMPLEERDQFAVEIFMPNGTTAQRTAQVADSLEHILKRDSRVTAVTSFIGQGSPRFNVTYAPQIGGTNFAQFIVNTVDNESAAEVLDKYADRYAQYFPDAYVRFKQMDYNNAAYPVEIRISGDSLNVLRQAADKVVACMRQTEGLQLVRTNFEEPQPGVSITLNEAESNRLGINKALLTACLAVHYGPGVPVTSLWEGDYPVGVVLKTDHKDSTQFTNLGNEYIPVMGGTTSVPLRQFATIKPDFTDGCIVRRNGVRTISVVAEPMRGYNADRLAKQVETRVAKLELPKDVEVHTGGMLEKDTETLPQVSSGVLIAVFIIFFILLFHFKRISLALVNLSSMSLCVFGAAVGLLVTGYDMSITGILGVVSLMGILVRNGIIMLDYAEELRRDKGLSVREAAFQAGERRMRPIFLTSAAASVGVLPMMLENNTLWSPMAAVVFFGTLISMVLIATVLPVLYAVVFDKSKQSKL
ncbi:MAG: efflux RND transporter permease subunit [Prevotella sp.]|uniref:efflux RND transporter permease subunit n=1 Tax=Prevotella sp. TaxID=59823 RepID=UPI0025F6BB4A|nr:efflux RND transporter permease subunit [Prevotella sp.]MCI7120077.1 efflux RND transporter permease subunit [Prevotella sp.]